MLSKDKIKKAYIDRMLDEIEYHDDELKKSEQDKKILDLKIENHKLSIEYINDILKEFTSKGEITWQK
mgnify:CR=1 FL=1